MGKRIHQIANEIGDPTTELGQRVRGVVDTMIVGGLIDWLHFSIPELRSEHELWFNQFGLMPWVDDRLAVIRIDHDGNETELGFVRLGDGTILMPNGDMIDRTRQLRDGTVRTWQEPVFAPTFSLGSVANGVAIIISEALRKFDLDDADDDWFGYLDEDTDG
jgi:hypothetical protein